MKLRKIIAKQYWGKDIHIMADELGYVRISKAKGSYAWLISELYVEPKARRSGVAKALLKECIKISGRTRPHIGFNERRTPSWVAAWYERLGLVVEEAFG